MSRFRMPRLFRTNVDTWPSASPRLASAAARLSRSPASWVATSDRFRVNRRTCWSLSASVVVNFCRLVMVPTRLSRFCPTVRTASERSRSVRFSFAPSPSRFAAPTSRNRFSAPLALAPFGPSATDRSFTVR